MQILSYVARDFVLQMDLEDGSFIGTVIIIIRSKTEDFFNPVCMCNTRNRKSRHVTEMNSNKDSFFDV
jgi:hypothetical protein